MGTYRPTPRVMSHNAPVHIHQIIVAPSTRSPESHQITARVYCIASDNAAHNTHAESKREGTRRIKPKSGEPRPIEFWQGARTARGVDDVGAFTTIAPVSNARDETAAPRFAIYAVVAEGARGTFGLRCGGANARIKRTGKRGENVKEMKKSVKGKEIKGQRTLKEEQRGLPLPLLLYPSRQTLAPLRSPSDQRDACAPSAGATIFWPKDMPGYGN
ncbi:hypothetical protein BJ912DRAFT_928555 [Pholiota molesta]|nr:hypothetical protein BJ912DRAFT_928555 [Pholiota molesta]